VEKYRPVTLDDVVSHKDIIGTSQSSDLRCFPFSSSFPNQLKNLSRRTDYLIFSSMARLVPERPRQLSPWQGEYTVTHFANKSLRWDAIHRF
jgi:hypothetical protein